MSIGTARSRELKDAIHALVRWGGAWMTERDGTEAFQPSWLVVALRALLPTTRGNDVQLNVEGVSLRLTRSSVELGGLDHPDAVVEGSADQLLGVVTGQRPLSHLDVHGDRAAAAAALQGTSPTAAPE